MVHPRIEAGVEEQTLAVAEKCVGIKAVRGNQREAVADHGRCAAILMDAGRLDEADARFETALITVRQSGDMELEGTVLQRPIFDRLWFAHTRFTDAGATHLAALTQLKRCGVGSADKSSSGEAVAALTKLPLEDLALLGNQATPVGLAHATRIATLRRLDVSHAPTVSDESMPLVARMPKLEDFKLGSAQITDAGLQSLAASKSLKRLSLSGLKNVTPAGIEQLRKARPELVIQAQ